MAQLTQDKRLISISSPLGKDKLLLTSFQGTEYISGLYEFQLEVLSSSLAIKPEELIGKQVTVTIQNQHKRKFNGYVCRFSFGEIKADNLRQYRLVVVPWLWFLTKNTDNRIFQDKDTKAIVTEVFQEAGFNDFKFNLAGATTMREYCVQFGETDFDFVSRLLEEDGIAYYFKHENDKHTLVLTDQKNAYENCIEAEVGYSKGSKPGSQFSEWEHVYNFVTGTWTHTDYNFESPQRNLITTKKTTVSLPLIDKFENYTYPGYYTDKAKGDNYIIHHLEAEEAGFDMVKAVSDCSTFYAGGKFKLKEHDTAGEKKNYIITSITHNASDSSYFSGSEDKSSYSNSLICLPDTFHFRPALNHKKPLMKGPQSALVVGPSGEEIYIDKYGRIKVQFYWDRVGTKDEKSTCFIRVVQSWAGNQWGTSFIPRMGQEVIVNYIDGDPDRPLVTGAVYNADNMPTYPSKTQSGIKTRSTKGGTSANFNELRFEDKKGEEQIYVHAEKNLDTKVENDETHTVDHNRTKTIGDNETSNIGKNRDKTVGENQSENIGKDKSIAVGVNHTENIGKNKTLDVGENHTESVGKNMTIAVGKDLRETVDGKYTENVTKEYSLKAKSINMQADDEIVLQTGSASITMKKNGDITIKGNNITVNGSGNVVIKGSKVTTN